MSVYLFVCFVFVCGDVLAIVFWIGVLVGSSYYILASLRLSFLELSNWQTCRIIFRLFYPMQQMFVCVVYFFCGDVLTIF